MKRYLQELNAYVLQNEMYWKNTSCINIFSVLLVWAWQKQFKNKNQCIWINIMKGHKRKERFIVEIQERNQFFKENLSQSENKFPLLLLFLWYAYCVVKRWPHIDLYLQFILFFWSQHIKVKMIFFLLPSCELKEMEKARGTRKK